MHVLKNPAEDNCNEVQVNKRTRLRVLSCGFHEMSKQIYYKISWQSHPHGLNIPQYLLFFDVLEFFTGYMYFLGLPKNLEAAIFRIPFGSCHC